MWSLLYYECVTWREELRYSDEIVMSLDTIALREWQMYDHSCHEPVTKEHSFEVTFISDVTREVTRFVGSVQPIAILRKQR